MSYCSKVVFVIACLIVSLQASASNNWAVLVATSRFWSNYRETVNLYYFYETVRSLGIPDSRIVMFLGEDIPCNARNPYPGELFGFSPSQSKSMYPSESPRVDIHGNEVNRKRFLDLISSRYDPFTPRSQRLGSDKTSNVYVYLSGHSAVGYTKFQDVEDLSAVDIADSFEIMRMKQKYNQVFWMSDTCRAASLHNAFYSPEIACLGSSGETDKSYSHPRVNQIGQALIDKFTTMTMEAVKKYGWKSITLRQLFNHMDPERLGSQASIRTDLLHGKSDIRLIDYMGASDGISNMQWPAVSVDEIKAGPARASPMRIPLSKTDLYTRHDNSQPKRVIIQKTPSWNSIIGLLGFSIIVIYSII